MTRATTTTDGAPTGSAPTGSAPTGSSPTSSSPAEAVGTDGAAAQAFPLPWAGRTLLGFDTETTGVDTARDRIVTAALVTRTLPGTAGPGSTAVRTWCLQPGVPIPPASTAVHGVTDAAVRAAGLPARVGLEQIARTLAAGLRAGGTVVAFNAGFDLAILDAELARHALPSLSERLGASVRAVVDPLVLDRALVPRRSGKRTLGALTGAYGVVPAAGGLHTADVDVLATLDVLGEMVRRFPELGRTAPTALYDQQAAWHHDWATELQEWRAAQGYPGPGPSTVWP